MVAAAAYRCGTPLCDERYGITHNYAGKRGAAVHSEIIAPAGSPPWVYDREGLWNRVEAAELRKDSQLARGIDVSLPIELVHDECLALVRDYVAAEFVSKGMIADVSIRRDDSAHPHAYVLLTLRRVTPAGFGPKERRWNGKSVLFEWRAAWAERANEHLARAGHSVRIDHRTLEAQQIELTPARRVGFRDRRRGDRLPDHLAERLAEQRLIAKENGEAIAEDPAVVLRALTHQWPTFTLRDLARFLQSRTDGAAQFDAAYLAVTQSQDLVPSTCSDDNVARFTSRDMLEAEKSLVHRALSMAMRRGRSVAPGLRSSVRSQFLLNDEQCRAFDYLLTDGDAKAIEAVAGDLEDALLTAAHRAWEAGGSRVAGVARSRTAAESLQSASGIKTQPLETCEDAWRKSQNPLTRNDVLVVAGAEMIGLKALERVFAVADRARAKLVLVGDVGAAGAATVESPFRRVLREIGPHGVGRTQA